MTKENALFGGVLVVVVAGLTFACLYFGNPKAPADAEKAAAENRSMLLTPQYEWPATSAATQTAPANVRGALEKHEDHRTRDHDRDD